MLNGEKLIDRPLRWGMVGGGRTGQVGYKHRTGALRDHTAYRMVCGAFDLDVERGRDFGLKLGVAADRLYPRLQGPDRRGSRMRRRRRGRHDRDPELHPLRDRQSLPRSGAARDLREAALLHCTGLRGDRGLGRGEGSHRRRDLWLHRPSARPPNGRHGEEGHARRDPSRRPQVHSRLQLGGGRQRLGSAALAHECQDPPGRPSCSATSALTSTTCPRSCARS